LNPSDGANAAAFFEAIMMVRKRSAFQIGQDNLVQPVSDPTPLTTQQLGMAIDGQRDLFDTRLDAMDKAIDLLQEVANRSPTVGEVYARFDERFEAVAASFKSERDISDQKFLRVDQQFIQIEKLAAQLKIAGDTAVAAALQAQKEAAGEQTKSSTAAISKSETSTADSIKQLHALFQTSIGGLSSQIADLKSRLDKGEGQGVIRRDQISDDRYSSHERREVATDNRGAIYGIISIAVAFSTVVVSVALHLMK
jgi:hypothetical protein